MVKIIKQFLLKNKLIVGILALAAFLIFYRLGSIPNRMQTDEASIIGVKLVSLGLQYFTWNDLLQHLSLSVFGSSFFALRLPSALASLLSVVVFYFFAKEIFKTGKWAELAALIFATNRLFLAFSRITHATALQLLFTLLAYLFFFKLLNSKRKLLYAVLCGLNLGVEIHTYTSGLLMPLVIGFGMLAVLLLRKDRSELLPYFLVVITTSFVAGLPRIIMYFLPGKAGLDRASEVSILSQIHQNNLLLSALKENARKIIKMFYFQGELTGKHNFYGLPVLNPAAWLLFVVGAISSTYSSCIRVSIREYKKVVIFIFLIFALGVPLLANLITRPSDVPSFLRSYPFIIPIPIFITFGIKYVWERVKIIRPTLIFLTLFTVCFGPYVYFFHQAKYLNTRGWLEAVEPEIIPYNLTLEQMKQRAHIYSESYNKYLQVVENGNDFSKPLCLDNGTIDKNWAIFFGSKNLCDKAHHTIQIDERGDITSIR